MHEANTWLTLTYDDDHLPSRFFTGRIHPRTQRPIYSGTLYKPHVQALMRTLRKRRFPPRPKGGRERGGNQSPILSCNCATCAPAKTLARRLRYYYAGEYGEQYGRPHYHVCLFGIDFQDKLLERTSDLDFKLYTSATLAELWPYGSHLIGELTWESAAYTARYIMKKITGQRQKKHYEKIDQETGEIIQQLPEYNDMSRRPGIAKPWYDKFSKDVYPHDRVLVRGNKTRPPRYYDKLHQVQQPDELELVKFARQTEARLHWRDHTDERLKTAEIVTKRRIQSIKQKF